MADPSIQNPVAEVLECKKQLEYWGDRLEKAKALIRRKTILACIDDIRHLTDDNKILRLWRSLTQEEQQDKEIVYKILASKGTKLFGPSPWQYQVHGAPLPAKFMDDPDAVLAFMSCPDFRYHYTFQVPESLRDDKRVMLALCSKNYGEALAQASESLRDDEDFVRSVLFSASLGALQYASERLRDNEDFVRAVLFSEHGGPVYLMHASDRLKKNTMLILDLIEATVKSAPSTNFAWLDSAIIDQNEEERVARAILSYPVEKDKHCCIPCRVFSESLRDDKDIMLAFVKLNWRSLYFCSERLRGDKDVIHAAVLQDLRAYNRALGPVREEYDATRTLSVLLEEIANGSCCYIPESMKTDHAVVMASLKAGGFWKSEVDGNFYNHLPRHLKQDEEIAMVLLKEGFFWFEEMFENIPSLLHSREAMTAVFRNSRCDDPEAELLRRCPFRDDKEIMIEACRNDVNSLEYASDRLKSDREFMEIASLQKGISITYSPPEFQLDNLDLVMRAIETCGQYSEDLFFDGIVPAVWNHRPAVLAWLHRGWSILSRLRSTSPESPFLSDREIVSMSVANDPADLQYASQDLRNDREFVLSLVKQTNLVLNQGVSQELRKDYEILLAAVAQDSKTIVEWFDGLNSDDEFGFLCQFAMKVRSKLAVHHSFVVEFLRGIAIHDQATIPPANRCPLPLLDRGLETSTAFKKKIAEYVGVPVGEELQLLRAASCGLEKFGY